MDKSNISSGEEEYHSCEVSSFQLKFFAGTPPKEFANLSGHELNRLIE